MFLSLATRSWVFFLRGSEHGTGVQNLSKSKIYLTVQFSSCYEMSLFLGYWFNISVIFGADSAEIISDILVPDVCGFWHQWQSDPPNKRG